MRFNHFPDWMETNYTHPNSYAIHINSALQPSGYLLPLNDNSLAGKERAERGSRGFGSAHKNGINAAFGDGSARVVKYTISVNAWVAMCGRNDGLIATE
jgi:prepilin-type processing-associated H-X9-DG protein